MRNENRRNATRNFFRNVESIFRMGGSDYAEMVKARGDMARAKKPRPIRKVRT